MKGSACVVHVIDSHLEIVDVVPVTLAKLEEDVGDEIVVELALLHLGEGGQQQVQYILHQYLNRTCLC